MADLGGPRQNGMEAGWRQGAAAPKGGRQRADAVLCTAAQAAWAEPPREAAKARMSATSCLPRAAVAGEFRRRGANRAPRPGAGARAAGGPPRQLPMEIASAAMSSADPENGTVLLRAKVISVRSRLLPQSPSASESPSSSSFMKVVLPMETTASL